MFTMCLRVALSVALLFLSFTSCRAEDSGPVKLAVMVIIDQFRGDYPARWKELYAEGGLRRLMDDGAWFQKCNYDYCDTVTGPGHASLATGCSPATHGIILNEWYDRQELAPVYCAGDSRYQQVPARPPKKEISKKAEKGSGWPGRLLAPTLADALRNQAGKKAHIVALSLKDRSSILPGGQSPDACYWFDAATGNFVTSNYYRDRVHPWVEQFNRARPADRWFGKDWVRLRNDIDYERWSGPDDVAGEGSDSRKRRTFPHAMDGGLDKPGPKYYDALCTSPFGNDLLLELTKQAIAGEDLGKHESPDLLSLSFSSNDLVGHVWGPDSQEVMDTTLRTDRVIRQLLDYLDTRIGRGRYVLALSADHGVCPLPEVSRQQKIDAQRVLPVLCWAQAEAFLQEHFAKGRKDLPKALQSTMTIQLVFNPVWLKAVDCTSEAAEKALAGWLKGQPFVTAAYTRTQLLAPIPDGDAIGQAVRRSFHPQRSGDVLLVLKPYYLLNTYLTGTTHGSPHPYDTHVPLFVFGGPVKHQVRQEAVKPQAMTAILARALGIQPPEKAEVKAPEGLFAP